MTATRSSHAPGDGDHDPTGVRDLLGSLPDPGPMPGDLVARITASLEAESRARRPDCGLDPAPVPHADGHGPIAVVVPLHQATRRPSGRRMFGLVASAAAAVTVFGIAMTSFIQSSGGDLSTAVANLGSGTNGSGSSAASSARAASTSSTPDQGTGQQTEQQTGQSTDPGTGAAEADVQIRLAAGPLTIGEAGLAAYGRELLQQRWTPTTPHTVEQPTVGPIGTPTGVRDCLHAVGGSATGRVAAEITSYAGRPAVLIAAQQGADRRTIGVYLAAVPCGPSGATLLVPAGSSAP